MINIWSSRDLSIYGKLAIIKALIVPFFSLVNCIPATHLRKHHIRVNLILFRFFWKGTDEVERVPAINACKNEKLITIYLESMIQSPKLTWIKRINNMPVFCKKKIESSVIYVSEHSF